MAIEILESTKGKSLLEDYDYEEKIRTLDLNERISWFVENKPNMSQAEKWEAFDDIMKDHDFNYYTKDKLVAMINRKIRKNGKEE